jgi:hypothetical protein
MNLDMNSLMLSLLFGTIGMGLFMFGKSTGKMAHLGAGVALMVCPYFIPNLIAMSCVCIVLMVTPFFLPQ